MNRKKKTKYYGCEFKKNIILNKWVWVLVDEEMKTKVVECVCEPF